MAFGDTLANSVADGAFRPTPLMSVFARPLISMRSWLAPKSLHDARSANEPICWAFLRISNWQLIQLPCAYNQHTNMLMGIQFVR